MMEAWIINKKQETIKGPEIFPPFSRARARPSHLSSLVVPEVSAISPTSVLHRLHRVKRRAKKTLFIEKKGNMVYET